MPGWFCVPRSSAHFNTYMRKAGVAESVIMQITGHSTREMFDRYNRIDEEDIGRLPPSLRASCKC